MFDSTAAAREITRRYFFRDCSLGLGKIALASLAGRVALADGPSAVAERPQNPIAERPLAARAPHFRPKAKAVIHLFMAGAPSHLELFDYKPALARFEGRPIPPEIIGGQRYAFIRPDAAAMGPRFKFARHGNCGAELAEVLPRLARIVDEISIVKSMHTEQFNHAPAQIFLNSGFAQPGRPCMGSWVSYGLGAETSDLPAFLVMSTGSGISGGAANWSSGFLPSVYAGTRLRAQGDPILDVSSPPGVDARLQRESFELVAALNRQSLASDGDPEIATRIASYEMAARLQTSAPELMDLSQESKETLDLYGVDPATPSFARSCLLARRMVERGVRFVNIYHEGWDAHNDVVANHTGNCRATDQASAALVADLKRRGLLDETMVIWGGEFGRTPMVQANTSFNDKQGRDHHPQAFSIWLAGGGIRQGYSHGATDELGFNVVEGQVAVHDLQATILRLLGLDHERLTYRYAGRDFRLTDVHGHVVTELLA